ncbi:MAG: hypothetical protein R3259_01985 [Salinimicrobium sediminis]|nr:hypothetical protein [Salinimicrobium sediminis]
MKALENGCAKALREVNNKRMVDVQKEKYKIKMEGAAGYKK